MKTMELMQGLYWNGVLDPDLRVFDIVMRTEFGTTYNSYVLKGSEKTALFETAKLAFWEGYKASIESIIPISEIDYIIVDHTEPDHAGSIEKLIEINPKIKVVGTGTAIGFLKHIVNREFYSIIVKENDTLSLGNKTLHFMVLPNLHWPDTMYTYLEEDKVLFTCDSFGSHYSHEGILRSTVTNEADYMSATKYYFDNIIGPYRDPYMNRALERIKDLDIEVICPGHGPVLDSHIDELMETYRQWCAAPVKNTPKLVVIPYVSAYGYTKQLAERISEGITDSGEVETRLFDMVTCDAGEVSGQITQADGVLFGTPTIIGEALSPIWGLTTSMFAPIHKGKLAGAFGSYGWSGEGVPHITERLRQLKLNVVEGFRVKFKPNDTELMDAYDYGYDFGCKLLEKENDRVQRKGTRSLVKCLVCGEIFDSSLEVCPVCGVGRENFVPVEDTDTGYRKDTDEKFLILGGGAAGYNAAKAIRERNATASVIMLTDEEELPYNRPMLTKAMLADFSDNQLAISDEGWYRENNITVCKGIRVTSIDTAKQEIKTEQGAFAYDKLIYALGANCFVPPIPGANQEHVVSIRRIEDTQRVKNLLPKIREAVVIGGGVLGLEAAWELRKGGLEVTVLETAPCLLPRQLDAPAASLLGESMTRQGIRFVTGAKITEITSEEVKLEDGQSFAAGLVIVSTGIAPNVSIAKEAGIHAERFIEVDEHMQTSATDVYACGDCAVYGGVSYALWSQAVEMGRVAGACAAGDDVQYEGVDGALTFNGLNTTLFALGDNGKGEGRKYRTVEMKDEQRGIYEKQYYLNNRLCGVILIGDTSKMAELTEAVKEHAPYHEVMG